MGEKRHLSPAFPHRLICAVSVIICLCAITSIIVAIVIWRHLLWGYYWATGFWAGLVLFFTGTVGIVCSCVRTRAAVTTFLITSILGCLVALGTVALSAGGLDYHSDFYDGIHRNQILSSICHGILLGLGTLELSLCVLSNGISIYYLFIEKEPIIFSAKDSIKGSVKRRQNGNDFNGNRYSSRSNAPLLASSSPKQSFRNSEKRKSARGVEPPPERPKSQVTDRATLRSLRLSSRDDMRSPCTRSASFSTFGHGAAPDRASLMLRPSEGVFVTDTLQTRTPSESESLYAETVLFGPPIPIEEDDELPPYEPQSLNIYENIVCRPKSEQVALHQMQLRRIKSTPVKTKRPARAGRSLYDRIPHGRKESNSPDHTPTTRTHPRPHFASIRPSSSIDFLRHPEDYQGQDQTGIRNHSRSSDRIAATAEDAYKIRTQSLRLNRGDKRLLRKHRALSAEFRVTRDNIFEYDKSYPGTNENNVNRRPSWIDSGETGHFAGNRIVPTRFSLRTPIRVDSLNPPRTAVPVKSITLPIFSPPPKPPRTHSVTSDDLKRLSLNLDDNLPSPPPIAYMTSDNDQYIDGYTAQEVNPYTDISDYVERGNDHIENIETVSNPEPATPVGTGEVVVHYEPTYTQIADVQHAKEVLPSDYVELPEKRAIDISKERPESETSAKSSTVAMVKNPPSPAKKESPKSVQDIKRKSEATVFTFAPTSPTVKLSPPTFPLQSPNTSSPKETVTLPTSPVVKQPPATQNSEPAQAKQTEYLYAKINKRNSTGKDVRPTAIRTSFIKETEPKFDNKAKSDKSVAQVKPIDDKVVISFVDSASRKSFKETNAPKEPSGVKLGTRDLKTASTPSDRIIRRSSSNSDRKVVFKPASPTFIRSKGARPKDSFQYPVPFSAATTTTQSTNPTHAPPPKASKPSRLSTRAGSSELRKSVTLPTSPTVSKPIFKPDTSKDGSNATSPRSPTKSTPIFLEFNGGPSDSVDLAEVHARSSASGSGHLHRQSAVDSDRPKSEDAQKSTVSENQSDRRSGESDKDQKPLFTKFI